MSQACQARTFNKRVQERVPLQYLVGLQHWHDMTFAVGPGVLIPRPETYRIVELVADALARDAALASAPWVDMGCGSGELLKEVRDALAEIVDCAVCERSLDVFVKRFHVVYNSSSSPCAAATNKRAARVQVR
jgi:methylase of polypeptide subunit release factors